jgi:hypothetical protein
VAKRMKSIASKIAESSSPATNLKVICELPLTD